MAYIIYLFCLSFNSVLLHHFGISLGDWEWWVSVGLMVTAHICGREYEGKRWK